MSFSRTPSQTVGPYLAIAMRWSDGPYVVADGTPGAFWLRGRVLDGAGEPIDDAVVETWQADPDGRFPTEADPRGFRGYGRSTTDQDGRWGILTLKPGRVVGGGDGNAPHLLVAVFARGLLKPVWTRIYFADEEDANSADPVLCALPPDRRSTLVAVAHDDGYEHDIRLQGERETVFFDV